VWLIMVACDGHETFLSSRHMDLKYFVMVFISN
jgi:hypothetical protein